MTEVFCNFALRNTKNQNRINGSGFVSLSWLTTIEEVITAIKQDLIVSERR